MGVVQACQLLSTVQFLDEKEFPCRSPISRPMRRWTAGATPPWRSRSSWRTARAAWPWCPRAPPRGDRKSTRLNSSHLVISYAVFCLKKKKNTYTARRRALLSSSHHDDHRGILPTCTIYH